MKFESDNPGVYFKTKITEEHFQEVNFNKTTKLKVSSRVFFKYSFKSE